jgi:phosphomannomutase
MLIRDSSHEPKLRVLAEAPDQRMVDDARADVEPMRNNGISVSI